MHLQKKISFIIYLKNDHFTMDCQRVQCKWKIIACNAFKKD